MDKPKLVVPTNIEGLTVPVEYPAPELPEIPDATLEERQAAMSPEHQLIWAVYMANSRGDVRGGG